MKFLNKLARGRTGVPPALFLLYADTGQARRCEMPVLRLAHGEISPKKIFVHGRLEPYGARTAFSACACQFAQTARTRLSALRTV